MLSFAANLLSLRVAVRELKVIWREGMTAKRDRKTGAIEY